MSKSPQSHLVKEKSAFLSLNHASNIESVLLALLFLFLPTQLGKHFWPEFSYVSGLRVDYLSPTLYFTDLLVLGLLFFFVQRVGIARIWQWIIRKKLLLACIVYFLTTALLSDRPLLGLYWWIKLVECTFVAVYIAHAIRSRAQVFGIALLLSIGAFFESLLAILQYLQQGSLNGWLYYLGERTFTGATPGIANASIDGSLLLRPYGTFSHPNVLAGYLLLVSQIIAYMLVLKAKGFIRFFGMGVLAIASIALFLSLSRIAIALWFAFVCTGLLWMVLRRTKPFHNRIALAAVVGSIISLVILPFSQTVFTRFAETSFSEEAILQRTDLIQSTLLMLQSNPLLGVGLGNFIPTLSPLQSPLSLGLYLQPVHTIYLLIAAETGLIGLSIFLLFLGLTYYRLVKCIQASAQARLYILFGLLLTAILIIGFFDHYFLTLQQGQLLFAVVLGLCWSGIIAS